MPPQHPPAPFASPDPPAAPGPPPDRRRPIRWALAAIFIAGAAALAASYFLHRPPAALRVPPVSLEVRQTAHGFVMTRTEGGRPLFQLRAQLATEMQRGHTFLSRVQLVVYDRDGIHADRISGQRFRYDPRDGDVVALGQVHIALEGPRVEAGGAKRGVPRASPVQVLAQQLAFNTKNGAAVVHGGLDFRYWNASGHADAAQLAPGSNLLLLSGHVRLRWAPPGQDPLHVTAARAVLDKAAATITLAAAPGGGGAPVVTLGPRRLTAGRLVFALRPDDTVRAALALGGVRAQGQDAGRRITLACDSARLRFRPPPPASAPHGPFQQASLRLATMAMRGHVILTALQAGGRRQRLQAASLRVRFARRNRPASALAEVATVSLAGAASASHGAAAPSPIAGVAALAAAMGGAGGASQIAAPEMRFQFGPAAPADPGVAARTVLRAAEAVGRGTLHYQPNGGQAPVTIVADHLQLRLNQRQQPRDAQAEGNVLWSQAASGLRPGRSGSADRVQAWMNPATGQLERMMETGHVILRSEAAGAAHPAEAAQGGVLTWEAGNGLAELTPGGGNARVVARMAGARLAAARFLLTPLGLTATGHVTAAFRGAGTAVLPWAPTPGRKDGSLPVTVTAERLQLARNGQRGSFRGRVRIWRGTSVLRAEQVHFDRAQGTFTASGAVRAEFVAPQGAAWASGTARLTVADAQPCAPPRACAPAHRTQPPEPLAVHVAAPRLVYSRARGLAQFTGGVAVVAAASNLLCQYLDIDFTPGPKPRPRRVVAGGGVLLTQPGRRAQARRAVYQVARRQVTLSGGSPSISDAELGQLAGRTLTFSPVNDTIRVESGAHTRTFAAYRVSH